MTDHRDKYVSKTPPKGVRAQTADPSDFAVEDTGTHDIIEDDPAANERLRRRMKETKSAVEQTFTVVADTSSRVDSANAGITTLRMETKKHIDGIKQELNVRLDGFSQHLSAQDVKIEGAQAAAAGAQAAAEDAGSKVDQLIPKLIDVIASDRAANRADDHVRLTATVDVDTHRQKAEIDEGKDSRKFRRGVWLKALGIVGTIGGLIVTMIETRGC